MLAPHLAATQACHAGPATRFIQNGNFVVADRLFTTESLIRGSVGEDSILSSSWDVKNPDTLVVDIAGGIQVQNLVASHTFDTPSSGQFETSELSRYAHPHCFHALHAPKNRSPQSKV